MPGTGDRPAGRLLRQGARAEWGNGEQNEGDNKRGVPPGNNRRLGASRRVLSCFDENHGRRNIRNIPHLCENDGVVCSVSTLLFDREHGDTHDGPGR